MTEKEARELYHRGEEAVVVALLDFSEQLNKLEIRLGMNSANSSKPPSTDHKLTKKTQKKNKKGKRGGQNGHKGTTLTQTDKPDFIEINKPTTCTHCHSDLTNQTPINVIKRQVFDIPIMKINVTEYQVHTVVCECCQTKNEGVFPTDVKAQAQYGKNLQALVSYFNVYQLIPHERLSEAIEDIYGHKISTGVIITMLEKTYNTCEATEVHIKELLEKVPALHCDETGVNVEGKLHWVHVASTSLLTYYFLHKTRGTEAIDIMAILSNYKGVAVHDHWSPYNHYGSQHSFCNAHHLRELQGVTDNEKFPWSADLSELLIRMNQTVKTAKEQGQSALSEEILHEFMKAYDTITKTALPYYPDPPKNKVGKKGRIKKPKGKNLLNRLIKYKNETLRFLTDFNVPFTNNQAERDLRMIKVKEKISGTIASQRGGQYFARIRGYISTVKKQGYRVLEELRNALDGNPFIPQIA